MKKLIVSALMALSCGVLFAADTDMYLYWMIGDPVTFKDADGNDKTDTLANYSARLSNGDGYLQIYETIGGQGVDSYANATDVQGWDMIANVTGMEGKSFFIELFNADGTAYTSDPIGYGDLGAYISSMKGMARPADTYSGFTTFTQAVPEPTSGLLLLLGVAGLALRRKNKKA